MLQRINTFKRGFLFLPIQSENNTVFLKWENKILPSTSKIFPYYTRKIHIIWSTNEYNRRSSSNPFVHKVNKTCPLKHPFNVVIQLFLRSAAFRIILHIETWVLLKHPTGTLLRKLAKHHAPLSKMASGIITLLPINRIWSLKAVRFIWHPKQSTRSYCAQMTSKH